MNTRTSGGNLYKVKFKGCYCLVILWPFAKVNKDAYSMQYGDLASTPDCEKDSLLGLTAPMQNLFQIFEITVLIGSNYLLYFLIFIHRLHDLLTQVLIIATRSLIGPDFLQVLQFFHFSRTGLKLLNLGFHGSKKHFILRKLKFFGG